MEFYRVNGGSSWLAKKPVFEQLDVVRQLRVCAPADSR